VNAATPKAFTGSKLKPSCQKKRDDLFALGLGDSWLTISVKGTSSDFHIHFLKFLEREILLFFY
jgi:hypothetical protein